MVDVSIIIVSWNAKRHLLNCLQSIRDTAGDLQVETIVTDNDSSDGSPEAVASDYPEAILVQTGENLGFARGNNVGIERSRGRYLALINSDVILEPGCLKEMTEYMDRETKVGISAPKILWPDRTFQANCRRLPSLWSSFSQAIWFDKLFHLPNLFPPNHMREEDHEGLTDVEALVGCFWFVRREAYDKVGGLDERFFMYGEDNDWCKRFGDAGWRVTYHPGAEAVHVGRASSSNSPVRFILAREKSRLQYHRKHNGVAGAAVFYGIMFLHHFLRLLPRGAMYVLRPAARKTSGLKIEEHAACLLWMMGLKGK